MLKVIVFTALSLGFVGAAGACNGQAFLKSSENEAKIQLANVPGANLPGSVQNPALSVPGQRSGAIPKPLSCPPGMEYDFEKNPPECVESDDKDKSKIRY